MSLAQFAARIDGRLRSRLSLVLTPSLFTLLYSAVRHPMLLALARDRTSVDAPRYPVEFAGLRFRNDLGNAAGFDKDGTLLGFNYRIGAGFAIVGTVLIEQHTGNRFSSRVSYNPWTPLPYSQGAINSLGLPNVGVDVVMKNILNFRNEHNPVDFPIGVSIMGHPAQHGEKKLEGTIECLRRVLPVADFVEINESCPNVHGHEVDDVDSRLATLVVVRDEHHLKTGRRVPLFVKLAGFGDAAHTVRVMTALGIDGLVGVNTQKNYADLVVHPKDRALFDYYTRTHGGGVSGQPIAHYALAQIELAAREIVAQKSHLKLIHVGGIRSRADMSKSRTIGDSVVLREWYTGMMEEM